eukprot:TRINITY_DN6089_c0_g1_i2.p2 TRINITY_DN6089_c0_g1~~TRINITY_DN6089_c0_g1_i2.p2  ORF type:complete len:370 (+),score=35.84 TRINITY_DN6089_c0_g1_i2:2366-3475(+)
MVENNNNVRTDSLIIQQIKKQIKQEFIPLELDQKQHNPQALHLFDESLMIGHWSTLREILVVPGRFSRSEKEVLAAFVSKANECRFCVNAHTTFATGYGHKEFDNSVQSAIQQGAPELLDNARLREIMEWFYHGNNQNTINKRVPFSKEDAPELLGTAFLFNYVNRLVDIISTRDEVMPDLPWIIQYLIRTFPMLVQFMNWIVATLLPKMTVKAPAPGLSSNFHTYTPEMLPKEFEWCAANEHIAAAFTAFAKAVDSLRDQYIPKNLQDIVAKFVDDEYDGSPAPISRNWVNKYLEGKVQDLSEGEIWAAKYMLLTVAARFQVDEQYENQLRDYYPSVEQRRSMCIWAAFKAAQKVAHWQWSVVLEGLA